MPTPGRPGRRARCVRPQLPDGHRSRQLRTMQNTDPAADDALRTSSARSAPADLSSFDRNDPGHFNGAGQAARYWDSHEAVSATCSSAMAAPKVCTLFEYGGDATTWRRTTGWSVRPADTIRPEHLDHREPGAPQRHHAVGPRQPVQPLRHPTAAGHQGIGGQQHRFGALRFINVHYLPAASVVATDAQVGYEYTGKTYAAAWTTHSGQRLHGLPRPGEHRPQLLSGGNFDYHRLPHHGDRATATSATARGSRRRRQRHGSPCATSWPTSPPTCSSKCRPPRPSATTATPTLLVCR